MAEYPEAPSFCVGQPGHGLPQPHECPGTPAWATVQIMELKEAVARLQGQVSDLRAELAGRDGAPGNSAMAEIVRIVADDFGLTPKLLCGDWRRRDMVEARHVAMWVAREGLGRSLAGIGMFLGRRDHKTVSHGVDAVAMRRERDPEFCARTDRLRDQAVSTIGGH